MDNINPDVLMSATLEYTKINAIPNLITPHPVHSTKVKSKAFPIWAHLGTLPVCTFVTEGLAKIYGFEVLRHGTAIPSYFSILKKGADPQRGGLGSTAVLSGKDNSGTKITQQECKGKFHVFKDSEAFIQLEPKKKSRLLGQVCKRTHTRFHAVLSGIALAKGIQNKVIRIAASILLGIIHFIVSPTLRFIYRKAEINGSHSTPAIFENDPDYNGAAYRTTQKLPSDRIGLIGIFKHATSSDAKRAWKASHDRVLAGVALLTLGVALTCIGVGFVL